MNLVAAPMPPASPGMMCHSIGGHGISTCMTCLVSGVPTLVGGTKVGEPRRYFDGWTPVYTVEDSQPLHTCPHCDDEGDYAEHDRLWDAIHTKREPRRVNKVGRNEPCPCGSGKKFKRCCGR